MLLRCLYQDRKVSSHGFLCQGCIDHALCINFESMIRRSLQHCCSPSYTRGLTFYSHVFENTYMTASFQQEGKSGKITSLIQSLSSYWILVPGQENELSCIYVLRVSMLTLFSRFLYHIFLNYFGVCIFCFHFIN